MTQPSRFVDEQVSGPFKSFRHEHLFNARDSGTEMIDDIWFLAPFGPIGRCADRLFVGRYLAKLISQRNDYLKSSAEAATAL